MAKKKASGPKLRRSCGAMAAHMMLLERFPAFRAAQMRLEATTLRRRETGFDAAKVKLVTIKTVVNVVYKTTEQNISDAQIKSQFKAMNKDFRATNPDRNQTPTPWKGLVSDVRLQFKLVKVTRTKTTKSGFGVDDAVKKASTGGIAQFPGGPEATDGVVINYRAFGTLGTAEVPFDKGRTATHEIGHYFNLRHIWGDTPDCSGSDMVADTPNCAGPNFGTPSWPVVTCNNGPNGDMFVNYMDYTDDKAMFMFTAQQVIRMQTALDTLRSGLV